MRLLFALAFCFVLFSESSWSIQAHGVLQVVKGEVSISSTRSGGKPFRARVGDKVVPGDIVITGPDSRAKIVMADQNTISVSPDSKFEIARYSMAESGSGKKEVLLEVIYGKVRSKVEQKYDGNQSKFEVKTPTAVAGVRGTEFITGYDPSAQTTQVVTLAGEVTLGNRSADGGILNSIVVRPGQSSSIVGTNPPEPPKPVAPQQMLQMEVESASVESSGDSGSTKSARQPANVSGGGSMLRPEDLGRGPDAPLGDEFASNLSVSPPPPQSPSPPVQCEFCSRIIESGNTLLRLIIRNP